MRISKVTLRRRRPATAPPPGTGCWAPDATLYFAPDGAVRACCVNTEYPLGHVSRQSIREIWEGVRTRALRDALARGDFSLGCQECGAHEAAGNRAWSNAPQFDEYRGTEVLAHPRRMDFILSNTCNLMCEMCHGGLSSAIRAKREKLPPLPKAYGDDFFDELREFLPHLERAVFLGGEPFLAREARRVWDLMIEMGLQIPTTVVTNGTQWNERVERYLREIPMDVTVSIDGVTAETVESLRVGTDFDELMANVDRYQEIVEARGGAVSLHYCLMAQNWHELGAYLEEADRKGRAAIIMTVTTPARFSLFRLPRAELERVLASWEAEDRHLRPRLERNLAVWDAELDRLRRHLAELDRDGAPAWLEATSEPPVEDGAVREAFEQVRAELRAWAGRDAIRVRLREGVIVQVDAPDWADPLEAPRWVGVRPDDLPARFEPTLGPAAPTEVEQPAEGLVRTSTRFGERAEVRSVVLEARDGSGAAELLVYLPDLAAVHTPA